MDRQELEWYLPSMSSAVQTWAKEHLKFLDHFDKAVSRITDGADPLPSQRLVEELWLIGSQALDALEDCCVGSNISPTVINEFRQVYLEALEVTQKRLQNQIFQSLVGANTLH